MATSIYDKSLIAREAMDSGMKFYLSFFEGELTKWFLTIISCSGLNIHVGKYHLLCNMDSVSTYLCTNGSEVLQEKYTSSEIADVYKHFYDAFWTGMRSVYTIADDAKAYDAFYDWSSLLQCGGEQDAFLEGISFAHRSYGK